jgi:hypothetical protein
MCSLETFISILGPEWYWTYSVLDGAIYLAARTTFRTKILNSTLFSRQQSKGNNKDEEGIYLTKILIDKRI